MESGDCVGGVMDPIGLCLAGAARQAQLVRDRVVSARELVEATLHRIESLDPRLNAYRTVFADRALQQANDIDRGARDPAGLTLLGVPIAIKDDTDVAGEVTAWGTDAAGPPAAGDAEVVTRLRNAGAIIIGKTNVPELTAWPWTSSPTWGITRNPWDAERTPGGSSGGSAAAAATGMCGVALGSDGGGSVRYPAALTGLFGFKPQRDRIPLGVQHADGWNGLLAYGSLSRTVADAALFLDATSDSSAARGFVTGLDASWHPRLRVAVSFEPPPGSMATLVADRRHAVEAIADLLRELGHDVFEREITYTRLAMRNTTVRYLAGVHHDATTVAHPERLGRSTRRLARIGALIPQAVIARSRRAEHGLAASMNQIFDDADIVLTPIAGSPPPLLNDIRHRGVIRSLLASNNGAWAMPWNAIGQPAASVPAGLDAQGLPLAIQLCGRPNDDSTVLRLAHQIEVARPWAHLRPH
jgi:amidase